MKKVSLLLAIIAAALMWSCGGNAEKNQRAEDIPAGSRESLSLGSKEGMMMTLDSFGIVPPAELEFQEVTKKSNSYRAVFLAEDLDEDGMDALRAWFDEQTQSLTAAGWTKREVRTDEKMFGTIYNEIIFMRPKGGQSTLSQAIHMTAAADPEAKTYKLYISPEEV